MATEKQSHKFVGLIVENQLSFEGWSGEDLQWAIQHPKEALELFGQAVKDRQNNQKKLVSGNPYLRRLYDDARITIPVTGGQRLIADSKKVFTWGIDGDFKNWGLMKKAGNTPETDTAVFELYADATFAQFFGSFGKELNMLCFTQDQIIAFCENHKDKLRRDGWANFFLMKQDDKFFVVLVYVYGDGRLLAYVHQFGSDFVWVGVGQPHVVVPATTL